MVLGDNRVQTAYPRIVNQGEFLDSSVIVALITASFALITSLGGIFLNHKLDQGVKKEKDNIDDLAFVVTKILSDYEYFFLSELSNDAGYRFQDNHRDRDHLRRLRDLKMISQTPALQNISKLKKGDILKEKFTVAAAGNTYLKIRKKVGQKA